MPVLRSAIAIVVQSCGKPPGIRAPITAVLGRNSRHPLAYHTRYAYISDVEFEWDQAKSNATQHRRGIDFARAAEIFTGRLCEWSDARRPYGEARVRALGFSAGEVLHVLYTKLGTVI